MLLLTVEGELASYRSIAPRSPKITRPQVCFPRRKDSLFTLIAPCGVPVKVMWSSAGAPFFKSRHQHTDVNQTRMRNLLQIGSQRVPEPHGTFANLGGGPAGARRRLPDVERRSLDVTIAEYCRKCIVGPELPDLTSVVGKPVLRRAVRGDPIGIDKAIARKSRSSPESRWRRWWSPPRSRRGQ